MKLTYRTPYQDASYYLETVLPEMVKKTLTSGQYGADDFVGHMRDICGWTRDDPQTEVVFETDEDRLDAIKIVVELQKAAKTIVAENFSRKALLNDPRNRNGGKRRYETTPRIFPNALAGYAEDDLQKLIEEQDAFLQKMQLMPA